MTYSKQIAEFIVSLKYQDIPASVVEQAKLMMLDTLGVAFAGTKHVNAINIIKGISKIPGSEGTIKSFASDKCFNAAYATIVNGAACHVLDYDDTHTGSIVHGSAILTPMLLALGEERNATGEEMLEAFVAGWEVAARVGMASKGAFHKRGFHTTAISGTFGATVAAAKLMKLSVEEMVNAIGICGSQTAGVTEFLANSSSSKAIHVGWVGHAGIIASTLASAGMTGPDTIFEGRDNLYRTHGNNEEADREILVQGLGTEWETARVSIKPYPCCHFAHGFIDCALSLREEGITSADIKEVHCLIDEVPSGFVCDPIEEKYVPTSAYGAKFSLPYMFSCGLVDGEVTLKSFELDQLSRKDLEEVSRKITYSIVEPGVTTFPKYFPGNIVVTLQNGEKIEKSVAINRGNPDKPLTKEEVIQKFTSNVEGILTSEEAQKIIDSIQALEHAQGKVL